MKLISKLVVGWRLPRAAKTLGKVKEGSLAWGPEAARAYRYVEDVAHKSLPASGKTVIAAEIARMEYRPLVPGEAQASAPIPVQIERSPMDLDVWAAQLEEQIYEAVSRGPYSISKKDPVWHDNVERIKRLAAAADAAGLTPESLSRIFEEKYKKSHNYFAICLDFQTFSRKLEKILADRARCFSDGGRLAEFLIELTVLAWPKRVFNQVLTQATQDLAAGKQPADILASIREELAE